MQPINNLDIYNTRMRRSMYDKLWFVDKLPEDITRLYDYGCGDGTLLSIAQEFMPNAYLIGYDTNPDMRAIVGRKPYITLTGKPLKVVSAGTCLIASSVFHEIHSYSQDIAQEYRNIFNIGADYIAIRDMFYDEVLEDMYASPVAIDKVRDKCNPIRITQFESLYGSIEQYKNFIHFLMKYRYIENWEREVRENYIPNSFQGFIRQIPSEYKVVYSSFYTLPFLKQQVKKDFDIDLQGKTHGKILLQRVK